MINSTDLKGTLPYPETPWKISQDLFQRMQNNPIGSYQTSEMSARDPEWTFVYRYFEAQKPSNRSIKKIHCIHNSGSSRQFEGTIQNLEQEANNLVFSPKWQNEKEVALRTKVIERWEARTAPYAPFSIVWSNQSKDSYKKVKLLPLWHGTTAQTCHSICQTGFSYFGKHQYVQGKAAQDQSQNTDIGYFGSGIYFTNSARYAAQVYSDGNLLLAWVIMREPYPVVADKICTPPDKPEDMKKLEGMGAYQNYNAHYIPIVPIDPSNEACAVYYPCAEGQTPVCDELVVFNKGQTLVRFWVEMQVDLLPSLSTSISSSSLSNHTLEHLMDKIIDLVEYDSIKEDGEVYKLLDQKSNELALMNLNQPFTPQDQEFYTWVSKLLDKTGKVRDFVKTKLVEMNKRQNSPQIQANVSNQISSPLEKTNTSLVNPFSANAFLLIPTIDSNFQKTGISLSSNHLGKEQLTVKSSSETNKLKTIVQEINAGENSFACFDLYELGEIKQFLGLLSEEIITLSLEQLQFTNEDCQQIKQFFPKLKHLFVQAKVEEDALAHLKGMPLTSVDFSWCSNLTDGALAHLKGMPLTSVNFGWCSNLTDGALAHLKGMPLTSVNFASCKNLTDGALAHLKGMPLTSVNFSDCKNLTDGALAHLKGMPLTSVHFGFCFRLTDGALAHLRGMPLTEVNFTDCKNLTDGALAHLKGMPLTSVNFASCKNLTDGALAHLKGMPLTSVNFGWCSNLTDGALAHLKGMPLTHVSFDGCFNITLEAIRRFGEEFPYSSGF